MTTKPITVDSNTTIEDCAQIMMQSHVGSLVIKKGEKISGIITEQDIVRKVVATKLNPHTTLVKDAMITDLVTIGPEADIYDALVLMRDNNIRHLPVVHKGALVGYLTIKDVLKIEPQLFELMVEKFELREAEHKPMRDNTEPVCDRCGQTATRLYHRDGSNVCLECRERKD